MAKITISNHYPTLDSIDVAMEKQQDTAARPYLGMSALGHPCTRKVWLDFRFASTQIFKAATLRKFDDGHRCEEIQAARLRMVEGVIVDCLTKDGKQHGFSDHGGHLKGHMDGAILGILEAPKTWHVWEHKATDDRKKNALEKLISEDKKSALYKWDNIYFVQAQLYMHYSGMKRHYLTVSSAGGRTAISCRTDYQKDIAEKYIELAGNIIATDSPMPSKVSDNPDYFVCVHMCSNKDICHNNQIAAVTCRSCAHSEVSMEAEGLWLCQYHHTALSVGKQRIGCDDHIYSPVFLSAFADAVEGNETLNTVEYQNHLNSKRFTNGNIKDFYRSRELFAAADKAIIGDPQMEQLRKDFDGELAG